MTPTKCDILLVEDDENDVYFMTRAMEKAGLQPPIHVAINGQDAVDYPTGGGPGCELVFYAGTTGILR